MKLKHQQTKKKKTVDKQNFHRAKQAMSPGKQTFFKTRE
jgi:hypothetical protein